MLNKKRAGSDSEYGDDDDEEEEEEMPEEAGRTYNTSEKTERLEPIQTDPENDATEIHTDREIPQGENSETKIRRHSRNVNIPSTYSSILYRVNFWM